VGKGTFTQTGTWRAQSQGAVVTLTQQNGKPSRETMTFTWQGDKLVMTVYDKNRWGSEGFSVSRVALPIATLVGFVRYLQRSALTPDAVMTVQPPRMLYDVRGLFAWTKRRVRGWLLASGGLGRG
jgi:hypothetical protein